MNLKSRKNEHIEEICQEYLQFYGYSDIDSSTPASNNRQALGPDSEDENCKFLKDGYLDINDLYNPKNDQYANDSN